MSDKPVLKRKVIKSLEVRRKILLARHNLSELLNNDGMFLSLGEKVNLSQAITQIDVALESERVREPVTYELCTTL